MIAQAYGPTAWLAYCRPRPEARLRLFCFPYAGGSASAYRDWANAFPREIDVCPVQLPGREARIQEPVYTRMGQLVEWASKALWPYLDRPFCFFGHSMGAIVAFEIACYLRGAMGLQPSLLVVSGSSAPHIPSRSTLRHDLPENDMLSELDRLNGTPKEVLDSPDLMQLVLPVLRADLEVCETYSCEKVRPLACSIKACGGVEDSWTTMEDLEAWRGYTAGDFDLEWFPGGHFFINDFRHAFLQMLSKNLSVFVEKTGARTNV